MSDLSGSLDLIFYGRSVSSLKDVTGVGAYAITNASEMPSADPYMLYSFGNISRNWNYPIFAFNSYADNLLYVGRNRTNDGVTYTFSGWTQIKTN